MNQRIFLVTGNQKKLLVAKHALEKYDIEVEQLNLDTPEIQSEVTEEVAKYSVRYAAELTGKPVIKGDVGFCIESLKGFPGPFVKYINKWISAKKLAYLYENEINRKAYFIDALGYCEPGKEPVCFVTKSHGEMIDIPRGDNGVMVDSLFVPEGMNKTLAELTHEETMRYWDNDRFEQLADYLKDK